MNKLYYECPAKLWRQALPIGNGISGAMIYGGKRTEVLAINDCRFWSGYPKDQDNSESLEHLNEVRKLVFAGQNAQADKLAQSKLIGRYCESFMPLGLLKINIKSDCGKDYVRELDMDTAIHTVKAGGVNREAFASYPDKVIVYNIKFNEPRSVTVKATSQMPSKCYNSDGLMLVGNAPDYVAPNYLITEINPIKYSEGKGMSFCMRTEVVSDGKIAYFKDKITVDDAMNVTLYITTATGFKSSFEMPDVSHNIAADKCVATLSKVVKDYEAVKARHIADYRAIYSRHKLSLDSNIKMPTDKLIKLAKGGDVKNGLIELFYNYGKYMTVAGSRSGGEALNLQGIWNNSMRPPWSSNYTTNINAQMNYWGASSSNLGECIEPYVRLVREIMQHGKSTARVNYGCDGFACNHNVDIWRKTAPVQGTASYMYSPLCGAWLANEIYEHNTHGSIKEHLATVQELITESAKFICDYVVMHDGHYVPAPSGSPEAQFYNGSARCSLDYASAFELGIIRQTITNLLEFSNDEKLVTRARDVIDNLYPFSCGKTGLNEWHTNYDIVEKGHRHFSPLYAFYPARVIKYHTDKIETEWVRKLFHYRVDNCKWFIGWSAAWSICLAGRLHEADRALTIINSMLAKSVFSNLFNVHHPALFQIDGNFGFVAGVNEMLLYHENGVIELLPALPKEWNNSGSVTGMVTPYGEVSFQWVDGKVTRIEANKDIKVLSSSVDTQVALIGNITLVDVCNEV